MSITNEEYYGKENIKWLKENKEHLVFNSEFEDLGYAFAEVLQIYDDRTDKIVFEASFAKDEAEEFINMITK